MKKFLLIGFIIVLLIAVPVIAFVLVNQKTETTTKAAPSTRLSFAQTQPVNVGDSIPVKVNADPGNNSISFVKLTISYDGSKIKAADTPLTNSTDFPVTLEGPTNNCNGTTCTLTATVSIGADPTKAVTFATTIATINFVALAGTSPTTPLTFISGQNQVLSLATTDQPAENVFLSGTPGTITINGNQSGGGSTPSPSPSPSITTQPTKTTTGLICSNFTSDKTSGDLPFNVLLTVSGSVDNATISKVSFNFGDGTVQDVASGSGIGTTNITAQVSHSYKINGVFTASATITDNNGNISNPTSCSQTISVGQIAQVPSPTAKPTPPVTGPGQTLIGIGIAGVVLLIVGGVFLIGM